MDHISANLGVQKAPGGKKPIRKTEKKVATFLFRFLLETVVNILWGAAKKSAGALNGNVTPLTDCISSLIVIHHTCLHSILDIHNNCYLYNVSKKRMVITINGNNVLKNIINNQMIIDN